MMKMKEKQIWRDVFLKDRFSQVSGILEQQELNHHSVRNWNV